MMRRIAHRSKFMWGIAASWGRLRTVRPNIHMGGERRQPTGMNEIILRLWRTRRRQISFQTDS